MKRVIKFRIRMLLAAGFCISILSGIANAHISYDFEGYVATITSNSTVYHTNFDTGEQTALGPSGINRIYSMEVSPIDGSIYAVDDWDRNLWKIDKDTGLGTKVSGSFLGWVRNLGFSKDGTLYGISKDVGSDLAELMTIDLNTGSKNVISTLSSYTDTGAFAINFEGKGFALDVGSQWLYEIDLTNGDTTSLGYFNEYFSAFDYGPDGKLYGLRDWEIYTVDVPSLTATYIRDLGVRERFYSMGISDCNPTVAPVPVPGSALLSGIGLSIVGWLRRKKTAIMS